MLLMTLVLSLLVALQQGAPGVVNETQQDGSGGGATLLLVAIPMIFIVLAVIMAYNYARKRNVR